MTLIGVGLLVLCALSFSLLDVLRKKLSTHYSPFRILTLLMGAQIPLYLIWFLMSPEQIINFKDYLPWALVNILLNLGANVLIVASLRLSPLSNAIPLLALSPTFSLLFQPFFQIPVHSLQLIGALIVFLGSIVLNGVPRFHNRKDKGLLLMTLAAFCCGLLILFDQQSLRFASIPFHGLVQNVGMTLLSLLLERIFKTPKKELNMSFKEAPLKLWFGASAAAFLAGITQLSSLRYFDPGVVESVKRALVLFLSVSFGYLFFKEDLKKRKIIGVILIALGILLSSRA